MAGRIRKYIPNWCAALIMIVGSILAVLPAPSVSAASVLGGGQTLGEGGKLLSPDGHYALIMQYDGNLVNYAWPRALWASNTNRPGSVLEMQTDGNLVVYAPGHVAVWASGTSGHHGAYLEMQNDANMIIRASNGAVVWASGSVDTRLDGGQELLPGWQFQSPDRRYRMVMQHDGNLVLYNGGTAVWSTKTYKPGSVAQMQTDGNLVVYAPGHLAVWASGTFSQHSALLGQNDGNFVLYAPGNNAVWSTKTNTVKPAVPTNVDIPALTTCPTMRQGSVGSCVVVLQQYLNAASSVSPRLTVDGVFGSLTKQAVASFQSSRGVTADGIAGVQTLQALAIHKAPVAQTPAPTKKHPSSFNPQAAANWATENGLKQLWIPTTLKQWATGEKQPCTGFVSWALYNGGLPKEPDWFPYDEDPSNERSIRRHLSNNKPVPAFYAANDFVDRFVGRGWASKTLIYPNSPTAVSVGDIVYYQFDGTKNHPHLAIVTSIVNGYVRVTDQGGAKLYKESINRPMLTGRSGNDLTKAYPNMKVYILHWQ